MESIVFSLMDIFHIALMVGACYACYRWGHHRGMVDTVNFFEDEGIIEVKEIDQK